MKIDRIKLFRVKIPLKHFFETSYGRVYHEEHIIVRMESGSFAGYGESAVETVPYYMYETTDTVWCIQKNFVIPALLHQELENLESYLNLIKRIRGHNAAKCGFEGAFWHILTMKNNIPLYKQWRGAGRTIHSGVSIGIQDSIDKLLKRIEEFLEEGYKRIKIKIKPGWDIEVLKAIREQFGSIPLMADANSAYSLHDVDVLKALDEYDLIMIEQPLGHEDFVEHAELQKNLKTPVCLDESINGVDSLHAALLLNSCRIVNIKPARVGGYAKAIEIHDICLKNNIGVWCGGMLEFGIGRAFNVALCSLENFKYPGDVSSSSRYYEQDIVDPPIEFSQGELEIPDRPGTGFNVDEKALDKFTIDTYCAD